MSPGSPLMNLDHDTYQRLRILLATVASRRAITGEDRSLAAEAAELLAVLDRPLSTH